MIDELLENIIQLEKRIQSEVTAERIRADEWQQRELNAIEISFAASLAADEEGSRQMLAGKKAELRNEGAALEATSSAWCKRLSELDDTTLRDALKRYLAFIMLGGDHDHPNGQS